MAYCAGFEHDIFVSYASGDNAGNWIYRFMEVLKINLARRIPSENLDIWYDEDRLRGGEDIDPVILDAVRGSAVFISIVSRAYRESRYCQEIELPEFYRKARDEAGLGLFPGDISRIFLVLIDNSDPGEWENLPTRLRGSKRFVFHESVVTPGEYAERLEVSGAAFHPAMGNLCRQLEKVLNSLPKQQEPEYQAEAAQEVFIAAVDPSLSRLRDEFKRELEEGFRLSVHQDVPPPPEKHKHDEAAISALKASRLSVHLLSGHPGEEILFNKFSSYPRRQAELALASGKSRIFWVTPELDIDSLGDTYHAEFLRSLRRNADFIEGKPKRVLLETIEKRLRPRRPALPTRNATATRAEGAGRPANKVVLLEVHGRDKPHAEALEDFLQGRGIGVHFCDISLGIEPVRRAFRNRMPEAWTYVVVHGEVGPEWTLGRLGEAIKLVSLEKLYPAFWVCLSPSMRERLESGRRRSFLKYDVLDTRDGVSEAALSPLLQFLD